MSNHDGDNSHGRSRRDCGNLEAGQRLRNGSQRLFSRSRRDCGNLEAASLGVRRRRRRRRRSRRDCGNLEADAEQFAIEFCHLLPQSPRLRQS